MGGLVEGAMTVSFLERGCCWKVLGFVCADFVYLGSVGFWMVEGVGGVGCGWRLWSFL